ncbi:molybdenum cofactor guanylyltransferase [uncultured Dysosmobacter sp.]|uniref:molybdenum cofactor guanylyltransferase n=1 Tax=uncultured Dysosmobacter sp. TaxID=2591384 RepID=UPI0026386E55|nr:molybdenum cofactor guanylyltransferase [uncultured Dysosmobacter sp.]
MIPFFSHRNQIYPAVWNGRGAVEKHFTHIEDWQREYDIYRIMQMPHPELLEAAPKVLTIALCPQPTMLEELERQESAGFDPAPWHALSDWLLGCERTVGLLPSEGNLRNFLWDAEHRTIWGIDFENYLPALPSQCGASLIAVLLEYTPSDTPVKQAAAALLTERLDASASAIHAARISLQQAREKRRRKAFSGIVLAGGRSSRMGRSKAGLCLCGKTFLEWQIEKLRSLEITDILLSGANCPTIPGTRRIPDLLADRGPLGGLHACLQAAKCPQCVVLTVDMPLLPESVLAKMCRCHETEVTVLEHGGMQEPLVGVYNSDVAGPIAALIAEHSAPVRKLWERVDWSAFEYDGPEELILNCNTPEEFAQAEHYVRRIAGQYSYMCI